MYERTDTDKEITADNGARMSPVVTLKDEYGGRAQVCIDDHCFILMLKRDEGYITTSHWFQEAVGAIRHLDSISMLEARQTAEAKEKA